MQIQRIRRQLQTDAWPDCDCCDEPMKIGFHFSGEDVSGPRGMHLDICDGCLEKTKKSNLGLRFLEENSNEPK